MQRLYIIIIKYNKNSGNYFFGSVKINAEENPLIASKYAIFSVPTVKLFRNGEVVGEFIGVYPENMIKEWNHQIRSRI